MGKRTKRWPIWKIATAAGACVLLSPVLFWFSAFLEKALKEEGTDPSGQTPMLTLSSLVMMFGMAVGLLGVLGLIWLVVRIQDARTPAWKKQAKKRRF